MSEEYDDTIIVGQTLDLSYYISENQLENSNEITFCENFDSKDKIKYSENLLFTPDENDVGETYTFEIGEKELSIKVTDVPDSGANHQWNGNEGSGTLIKDVIGDENADYDSLDSWGTDAGAGDVYPILSDSAAALSSDIMQSFQTGPNGTIAMWIRQDNLPSDDRQVMLGTHQGPGSGSTPGFAIEIRDDRDYGFYLVLDGDSQRVRNVGDPSSNLGDWVFLAGTYSPDSMSFYIAEPDGYNVTELGNSNTPDSITATDWDYPPTFGVNGDFVDATAHHFDGAIDLTFLDDEPWSDSELQEWVDDTKEFYE